NVVLGFPAAPVLSPRASRFFCPSIDHQTGEGENRMQIISSIAGLVSFVVGIMVLIKLFQKEGALKGILGLICMLYTYIWGWQHAKEQNITNLMWVWT